MDDQNYLCGYTEIKLDDNYHIDHFIKRDIDPRQTFDWQNMIAAVHDSKFGADFKDKTVNKNDYNKRLKKYNCILNPVTENMENRFIFQQMALSNQQIGMIEKQQKPSASLIYRRIP